jgi:hypothetical protein
MQHPMAAQGLAVVLDPHGSGFGCAQGVDAEQVRQGTVVNRNGLGDLEEADQLEPVQALSPCLVLVDLRQSGVDDRVGRDQAVDVGESEESPNAVHHRVDRGRHHAGLAEVANVQLDVRALDTDQRVESAGLAPREPAPKLVGVQLVSVTRIPREIGHGGQLGRRHRVRLERQQEGLRHGMLPATSAFASAADRRTHGEAPCLTLGRRQRGWRRYDAP